MAQIIEITDFGAPELDIYARLTEAQLLNRHEPQKGLFIAESPLVIERALKGGCVPVSMLVQEKHIGNQAKDIIAACGDVPVYTAPFDVLTQLTGFQLTRGILCAMRRPAPRSVEEVCRGAKRVAVMEDVMNPTNVGAIFRSAAALGMDAVLLTPSCCDPLYRRSVRVSMGTVFQVPWAYFPGDHTQWPQPGMEILKNLGFETAAMALCDDTLSVDDARLRTVEKLAVILGTEGEGLAKSTIAACDYTVKIPMAHGVDSLNVAAASAVAFWELRAR
jgi:tRNA G18 (ribose-2'-O)-methylase SpoU